MSELLSTEGASVALYGPTPGSIVWDGAGAVWDGPLAVWGAPDDWQWLPCVVLRVRLAWGADDTLGVLTQSAAGSWAISLIDPDRLLDPLNTTSDWRLLLVAGTRVQFSYGGSLIRRGYLDEISHAYASSEGQLRASDTIGRLAQSTTGATFAPSATTLEAFVRAVVAEVGVAVLVQSINLPTDPPIAFVETRKQNAWELIRNAATDGLCLCFIDSFGDVILAPYGDPSDRGLIIGDGGVPMADLEVTTTERGIVTIVADAAGEAGRDAAAVARFGPRLYQVSRTEPGAAGWAAAILADRAAASLEVRPGDILPRDSNDLDTLANVQGNELIRLRVAASGVAIDGQALGASWEASGGDVWRVGLHVYIPGSDWSYTPGGTPATRTFPSTKDGYGYTYNGTVNYGDGTAGVLVLSSGNLDGSHGRYRAFLDFEGIDWTGVRRYKAARLRLYRQAAGGGTVAADRVNVRRVMSSWSEASIAWPGPTTTQSGEVAPSIPTGVGFLEIDVTEIVRAIAPPSLGGTGLPQFGFALYNWDDAAMPQRVAQFRSRETADPTQRPALLIDVEV